MLLEILIASAFQNVSCIQTNPDTLTENTLRIADRLATLSYNGEESKFKVGYKEFIDPIRGSLKMYSTGSFRLSVYTQWPVDQHSYRALLTLPGATRDSAPSNETEWLCTF